MTTTAGHPPGWLPRRSCEGRTWKGTHAFIFCFKKKKRNKTKRVGGRKDWKRRHKQQVRGKFFFFRPNGEKCVEWTRTVKCVKKEETSLLTSLCVYFRHFSLPSFLLLHLFSYTSLAPSRRKQNGAKRESKFRRNIYAPNLFSFFFFLVETFVNPYLFRHYHGTWSYLFFSFIILIFRVFRLQVVEGVGEPAKKQFY